jgi:hypothetical protein
MGHYRAFTRETVMTFKPGFIYMRSASIGQMIAYSKKTGCVICEDQTVYSPAELQLLFDTGTEADSATHLVKKIFKGEVVRVEKDMGRNNEAERIEGIEPESGVHRPYPAGNLPPSAGKSEGGGNGEPDLF